MSQELVKGNIHRVHDCLCEVRQVITYPICIPHICRHINSSEDTLLYHPSLITDFTSKTEPPIHPTHPTRRWVRGGVKLKQNLQNRVMLDLKRLETSD